MADNELFFDALEELDGLIESPERNQNHTNDDNDDGHSNPETRDYEIHINRKLHLGRNFSASSFSRETRVASNLSAQFSIQGYEHSYGFLTSDPFLGAQRSISEAPEEGRMSPFLVPVVASRGEFSRTDDNQSNPSEQLSSQNYFDFSNWSLVPQMEQENASSEADMNSRRKNEIKASNSFPEIELIYPDSMPCPPMPIQKDGNEAIVQDYKELKGESAVFSPVEVILNNKTTTDRVSIGSVEDSEAVSVAVPSGIQTLLMSSGKEKTFECLVCGKIFNTKHCLRRHGRIHTGEKPFACNMCGKRFTVHSTLKQHRLIHSGEKPHDCPWPGCDKKFRQKSIVESHLRTHTKEKPFTCDICHKGFAQSSTLGYHLLSHTGERPTSAKRVAGVSLRNRSAGSTRRESILESNISSKLHRLKNVPFHF